MCVRLAAAVGLLWAAPAFADDPARFVPRQANLYARFDSPRKFVEAVQSFGPLQELYALDGVKEILASTNNRRLLEAVRYYEDELGADWPELLDKLSGGGLAFAMKFQRGPNPPVLFVSQGTDAALVEKAFYLVTRVIMEELGRQESKDQPVWSKHGDVETFSVGNDFHTARVGAAILVANKPEVLKIAIDLNANGPAESMAAVKSLAKADKLVGNDALMKMWIDLKPAHESQEGKDAFKYPRGDILQIIILNGILDVMGKSPFAAVGLYRDKAGFRLSARMPAGRDASPEGVAVHLPPAGQNGSLPLLEVPRVLYASSFYLDLGKFWTAREQLLTEPTRKNIEQAEKNLGRFLAGRKMSELLTQVGPYHRVVVAAQKDTGYTQTANQQIPAFAFVSNMRDPAYGDAMEAILRATALVTGAQANLKMTEEMIGDIKLVGYRFPEGKPLANDSNYLRYNYSPCFARVGDQFVMASTQELGRDLVNLLSKPETNDTAKGRPEVWRTKLYSTGGVALLEAFRDQLLTQTILDRAVPVETAKKEADAFVAWLKNLGVVSQDHAYRDGQYRYDLRLTAGAKGGKK